MHWVSSPATAAIPFKLHLTTCPHCTLELKQLDQFMAQPDMTAQPSALDVAARRVRIIIGQLAGGLSALGQAGQPFGSLQLAGVRGDLGDALTYEAGSSRVALECDVDGENPSRRALTGLVLGDAMPRQAHLWRSGVRLASVSVDDLGNFEFLDIAPDSYELILAGPDVEIHIQDLPVA